MILSKNKSLTLEFEVHRRAAYRWHVEARQIISPALSRRWSGQGPTCWQAIGQAVRDAIEAGWY